MNTNIIKKEFIFWLIILLPFFYSAYIWNDLPEQVPTHWNIRGEIDDYSSKTFALLLLPLIGMGNYLLLLFIPLIDPRKKNYQLFSGTYRAIRLAISLFLLIIYFVVIRASMDSEFHFEKLVPVSVCLLFVVLGNYMGNIRPNWFVGIRTPWTLENEEVWRRTHKIGGKIFFFTGLAGLMLSFVIPFNYFIFWFLPLILAAAIIPVVYSFIIYKKITAGKREE